MTLGGRECVRIHRHKHIRRWGIFPERPVCFDKCFASLPSILQPKCSHESVAQLRWHKANPPPTLSALWTKCFNMLQGAPKHSESPEEDRDEWVRNDPKERVQRQTQSVKRAECLCRAVLRELPRIRVRKSPSVSWGKGTRSHQHASEKVLIRDCQRAVVYIVLQRRRLIHSFCFKLVWIVVQRILWATRFKLNCNHLGE